MMLFPDYGRGENLKSTIILSYFGMPVLRVSSASFPDSEYAGGRPDGLIETWIFSDIKSLQRNHQVFHSSRAEAIQVHDHIVVNLRRKFAKLLEQE